MIDQTIQRAQVYYFLSHALLYPQENWLEDLPVLLERFERLEIPVDECVGEFPTDISLDALQAQHREVFGLTGSLFYETELGMPHEFRQSQELADIAGFYRAFGFYVGAAVRERPDHLACELEFMYLLGLKEAYALENGWLEQAEICRDAQRKFLQDHLARWIEPFSRSLERSTEQRMGKAPAKNGVVSQSIYLWLAGLAASFVTAEAARLGVQAEPLDQARPTPYDPQLSCDSCIASADAH